MSETCQSWKTAVSPVISCKKAFSSLLSQPPQPLGHKLRWLDAQMRFGSVGSDVLALMGRIKFSIEIQSAIWEGTGKEEMEKRHNEKGGNKKKTKTKLRGDQQKNWKTRFQNRTFWYALPSWRQEQYYSPFSPAASKRIMLFRYVSVIYCQVFCSVNEWSHCRNNGVTHLHHPPSFLRPHPRRLPASFSPRSNLSNVCKTLEKRTNLQTAVEKATHLLWMPIQPPLSVFFCHASIF